MNRFTAECARDTVKRLENEKFEKDLQKCKREVESAVKSRKLQCTVYITPDSLLIKELKNKGFRVETHSSSNQLDSDYITISW